MKITSKDNYIKTKDILLITDPKKIEFTLEGGQTYQTNGFVGEILGHDVSCGFVGNADDYITYFRMFDYSTGISFAKFEVPSGAFVFLKEREKMEEFIKDRFLEVKDHLSDGTLEKLEEQLFGEPEVAEARPLTKEERRKLYDK